MGIVLEVQDPTTITRFDAIKVWRYDWIFKPLADEAPAVRTSPDMAYRLLTERPRHFRNWLKAHHQNAFVGYASDPNSCPLKLWLLESGLFGRRDIRVHAHLVWVQKFGGWLPDWIFAGPLTHKGYPTTGWMKSFIHGIDNYMFTNAVNPRQALTVLGRYGT